MFWSNFLQIHVIDVFKQLFLSIFSRFNGVPLKIKKTVIRPKIVYLLSWGLSKRKQYTENTFLS